MPAPYLYYVYPFAISADDLLAIPSTPPSNNGVNYQTGWTDPYELNLLTDPTALPIPRGQMNQLFFDLTNNIQEYQQYGSPQWVTGNIVPYPIFARVYYSGLVYENQVAANTATPGADTTWRVISGSTDGVPIGTVIDYAAPIAPTNYLLCDGSAINRTTYGALFSTITFQQSGTLTNTMNTVSGLSSTANMYVGMAIEGTNIPTGTTVASIVDSTDITMSNTATGGGASTITFFTWGNGNGSTTFNLPDVRRKTSIGSGGTASTDPLGIGNTVGQTGGEEGHVQQPNEIGTHNHAPTGTPSGGTPAFVVDKTSGAVTLAGAGSSTSTQLTTANNSTTNNEMNVIQPSVVMYKCIKYI